MRVLMLGWEFPPHISGGLGTACFGLTQALAKKNTEIIFVLPCTSDGKETQSHVRLKPASGTRVPHAVLSHLRSTMETVWQDKLTVHMVDSLLFPYASQESYEQRLHSSSASTYASHTRETAEAATPPYVLKGGYGKNLLEEVYRFSQMAAVIAMREDFDVIHVHDWMTYPAGILARQLTGKPLVAHIHATEYDRSGKGINEFVANIERVGLNAADRVIAVSHLTKNMVMEHYGVPGDRISVVHNAVARHDVQHNYTIPPRLAHEKRVLFLGRVTFQKGPDYFIEAARMVLEKMKNVRFFMAGSGDMLPRIIRRAGQLRIGNRFHFTGFLRGAEVDRMFALSDLYVMPSVSEPFGITPLEAMLYDVPVLLSKQSGVSEVLNHALKADFWDTRDMADKICAVLRYPCLARELVKNCHEEMKSIRWENAADDINKIYASVCETGGN